jgi:hypothetical protein
MGVVIQRATADESCKIRRERLELQSRDEAGQMIGVCADVADRAAAAVLFRVGTPGSLRIALLFDGGRHPFQRIFHLNCAHDADFAMGHPHARLVHHWIARIGVGHADETAAFPRELLQRHSVLQRGGQRLLADYIEARLDQRLRDWVMGEVRRADRHRVDAVLARSFARNQILICAVAAGGIQPLANGEFAAALWVDVKRARDELPFAVEARGETMDVADIGALSAAPPCRDARVVECSSVLQPEHGPVGPAIRA